MAGNGTEFTRWFTNGQEVTATKVADDFLVILRGWRWTEPAPLAYADLEEQQRDPKLTQVQYYGWPSPFTGFRVVLEPPTP